MLIFFLLMVVMFVVCFVRLVELKLIRLKYNRFRMI